MDKERFSINFELLMESIGNVLVKTNEEEFLYFLTVLPNMINYVAGRKNLKISTQCNYNVEKLMMKKG